MSEVLTLDVRVFAPQSLYYFIFKSILQWCFAAASWTTCDDTLKQVQTKAAAFCVPIKCPTTCGWNQDTMSSVCSFFFPPSEKPWDVGVTQSQHTHLCFLVSPSSVFRPEATAENRKASPFTKQLHSQCFICAFFNMAGFHVCRKKKNTLNHWV